MKDQATNRRALVPIAGGLLLAAAFVSAGCGSPTVASPNRPPVAVIQKVEKVESPTAEPVVAETVVAEKGATETKPPPAPQKGKRPPADRGPTRPGDAEKITFDDLNLGMREDMVFRPFLVTDRVKELEGKRIRIAGFIHAGAGLEKVKEFVLLKNTECKFGPGGQGDHLAMVYLQAGQTTKYQLEAIKVEGVLKVKPYEGPDGNTWSVYDLTEAKVVQ
jgi:hypothetical protein